MRLLLPIVFSALAAADQNPLGGWFDKAKEYFPSAPAGGPTAKAASLLVHEITNNNWKETILLADSTKDVQEWMVFFTGNTTCFDRCEGAEKAFNASSISLKGRRGGPKLGQVDCDVEKVLCATWSAGVPEIWHFLIPKPAQDQSRAASPLHIIPLAKNVTTDQIIKIHTEKTYLEKEEYTGAWHPIDGALEKLGLLQPLGYVLWGFGQTPSWLLMIAISFLSRQMMGRRSPGLGGPAPNGPAAPAAPPAAAR